MSKVNITISNLESLKKLIRDKVVNSDLPKIEKRVRDTIRPVIKELVIEELTNNSIYKGIIGKFANDREMDVQAHMGLYDFFAEDAANQIKKAFEDNIQVNRSSTGFGFIILANKVEDAVLNIPSASYESNNYQIPWIDWLVNGGGSVAAQIVFFREQKESRSTRALMLSGGEWNMNSYAFGSGPNFIDSVLQSDTLRKKLVKLIVDEYKKEVKRYYG